MRLKLTDTSSLRSVGCWQLNVELDGQNGIDMSDV
jgi:hypothetical protein